MKHRFETEKSSTSYGGVFFSILLFATVIFLFLFGTTALSGKSDEKEEQTLYEAVNRNISRCYALEGSYPESIDYLIENYGLMYDSERFMIDYHPFGGNIMPDVTIIDREDTH